MLMMPMIMLVIDVLDCRTEDYGWRDCSENTTQASLPVAAFTVSCLGTCPGGRDVDERAVLSGHRSQREEKLSGKSGTMESPVSTVRLRPKSYMFVFKSLLQQHCPSLRSRTAEYCTPAIPSCLQSSAPSLLSDSSPHSIRRLETAYNFAYWVNTPE